MVAAEAGARGGGQDFTLAKKTVVSQAPVEMDIEGVGEHACARVGDIRYASIGEKATP
jgi:hypothetical protein